MCVLSILALPLTLVEYYFTRERVTEETQEQTQQAVSMKKQLRALVTDSFWVSIIVYFRSLHCASSMWRWSSTRSRRRLRRGEKSNEKVIWKGQNRNESDSTKM